MEPLFKEKREISSLIPYRIVENEYEFFLQKRDKNARINPGLFGLFGGGLENGEAPEEGLFREIAEELSYKPVHHEYFSRFETNSSVLHVFVEEVSSDFESSVVIGEGDYGKFLKPDEILYAKEISMFAQMIIYQLLRDFFGKK